MKVRALFFGRTHDLTGFAEEELGILRQVKSAVFIRLGPRILRADTAAIATLSIWQAMRGDWQ